MLRQGEVVKNAVNDTDLPPLLTRYPRYDGHSVARGMEPSAIKQLQLLKFPPLQLHSNTFLALQSSQAFDTCLRFSGRPTLSVAMNLTRRAALDMATESAGEDPGD